MSKSLRIFMVLVLTAVFVQGAFAATYYVDSVGGSDGNLGTSAVLAWQSLSKVNSVTFSAGDVILFKTDCVWYGSFSPSGSGVEGSPIIVDKYGDGGLPVIDGNGMTGQGVVYLYNVAYWEINNLELTNDSATEGDRRGIQVSIDNFGLCRHIYLKDLYIHNIKGMVGQDLVHKDTAGIAFFIENYSSVASRFDDILIEDCWIDQVQNEGIVTRVRSGASINVGDSNWQKCKFTNFRVRNNEISNISKNAMIMRIMDDTCVVEYNVCHDTALAITGNTMYSIDALGMVFQFNEGYLNSSPGDIDGCMYDADLESPETVWQYSYSHDNRHGLFKFCTVQTDNDVIVRYNISQNDKGRLLSIRYGFTSAYIYNNVFYIPAHLSPTIIHEALKQGTAQEYYFYNNIIYNLSPTAVYDWYQSVRHIDNNVFYGYHPVGEPADANKMTFDPLFVAPGTAGFGIDSVDGYKLSANSPCIDAGLVIANNGGRDYWGNTVPYGSKPDVGAHEWSGDTAAKYFDGLDIGSVGIGGSFSEGDGFCSVTGSGEGVGGSEDEFYFVHREMDGNEEYVAQITDFNGTDSNSVAGLMMREDFSGLSSFAAVVLDGDGDVRLVWTEAGENTYQQIFFDGFAACFANWTNGGAYCSATCYPGDDLSCKMNNTEYAIHEEDTSGYDGIILKYARYSDFDTGTLFSEWYDGTDWHVIEQVTGGYEWQIEEFALPVGASDNPSFAIRFRVDDGGGSGFAYVDLVEIGTGTEPRQVNSSAGVSATIPCWVRLKKLCDNYAGSISTDGVNWTSLGEATIDMGRDIYAGMAVSSGSDSYTCKADFDNVLFDFVGDLDSDDDVDGFDLDSFAGQWLNSCAGPGWCGGSDMNEDGTVDMIDYAVLAYDWLIER